MSLNLPKNVPFIGETCLYYRQADTGQKPNVAMVTDIAPNGVLTLNIFPHSGGSFARPIKGVRHSSDPYIVDNAEASRRLGCWESLAEGKKRHSEMMERQKKKHEALVAAHMGKNVRAEEKTPEKPAESDKPSSNVQGQVAKLKKANVPLSEICKSTGLTEPEVFEILKEQGSAAT